MDTYYNNSMAEEEEIFSWKANRFDHNENKTFAGALLVSFIFMITFRLAAYINLIG